MENKQSALAMKYFLDNFPFPVLFDKAKPSNIREELAVLYLGRLLEVFNVFDRLIRYEKYFKEFIPPEGSGISESEAIEYHLRSYIEDFYILQERIRKICFKLIEDLPIYNFANQKDIEDAINHLSDQVHAKFENITSVLRREHVHERSLSELDLVIGKSMASFLTGEMPVPDAVDTEVFRNIIKKRYDQVLATSKEKHIKQSAENSVSLRKMKEWFASRFIYIFSNLNEHTIDGLDLNIV